MLLDESVSVLQVHSLPDKQSVGGEDVSRIVVCDSVLRKDCIRSAFENLCIVQ